MFCKRASCGNSSPCLECGLVGSLFSFAGSASSALLLAAASVMVVVSLFLVLTLYGGLRWPLTISPFGSNRESSSAMEFNCSSSTETLPSNISCRFFSEFSLIVRF